MNHPAGIGVSQVHGAGLFQCALECRLGLLEFRTKFSGFSGHRSPDSWSELGSPKATQMPGAQPAPDHQVTQSTGQPSSALDRRDRFEQLVEGIDHEEDVLEVVDLERLGEDRVELERAAGATRAEGVRGVAV